MGHVAVGMRLVGRRSSRVAVLAVLAVAATSCATSQQPVGEEAAFLERRQSAAENDIQVAVAVPSAAESKRLFGVNLYARDIQPVWLEIDNQSAQPVWFLPASVDPQYLTPLEVAASFGAGKPGGQLERALQEKSMGLFIGPGSKREGFVFSSLDEGTKAFLVDVLGVEQELTSFAFFVPVPGLRVDHREIDFASLHTDEQLRQYDETQLREALEVLTCCTSDKKGKRSGDPLNLVVIGYPEDLYRAFLRAGWDETETIYRGSLWKTAKSFIASGRYRYSPVSALYVDGRGQDVALQKARDTIHERNHLRLWMTPMRLNSQPVWIGQISRDIGVRFTKRTITTHKIDPDVDEARNYLLQDLWYAQSLGRYAFVKGNSEAARTEPRSNLTGDPYFSDGLRAVMWVSGDPVDMEEVEFLEWENPPPK